MGTLSTINNMSDSATPTGLAVPATKPVPVAEEPQDTTHTPSQRYLSTRGGSYGLSFEEVVLKGLASDGGLFIPEEIPAVPRDWESKWKNLSFSELAFEILSLYISPSEIPPADLKLSPVGATGARPRHCLRGYWRQASPLPLGLLAPGLAR